MPSLYWSTWLQTGIGDPRYLLLILTGSDQMTTSPQCPQALSPVSTSGYSTGKRMALLLLWLSAVLSITAGNHHPELQGSEGLPLEPQEKFMQFRKTDLSHYIYPFLHPWAHKLAAVSYIKHLKPTVTSTKTIVMQTVRQEKKHLICYKAHHGLPPCLPDSKEDNIILPTAVADFPAVRPTQFLGYLEGAELKQEDPFCLEEEIKREQRHLFGPGIFKNTEFVTKTLWVTKVEDYINTQVTATLLAANCVPCHANIPPCPEKVEHYVHYDLSHGSKPIREKNRENAKEYILEDRSGVNENLGPEETEEKSEHPDENKN